jgi:hypothetical protein
VRVDLLAEIDDSLEGLEDRLNNELGRVLLNEMMFQAENNSLETILHGGVLNVLKTLKNAHCGFE